MPRGPEPGEVSFEDNGGHHPTNKDTCDLCGGDVDRSLAMHIAYSCPHGGGDD